MFFTEKFQVSSEILKSYGAVDISLICDVPLFVDPMLIFNSDNERYTELHNNIIHYFYFLYTKATQGLTPKEIDAWFNFSEVPNNWLGYSLCGNKGLALGKKYANFLYDNIAFAIDTHSISKSTHIEKVMLLYEGSGKDKISDLTVNLIKGFLWALYIRKTSKRNCFRLGGQPAAPVTIGELSSIYSAIRRNSSAYLNFTLILPPS